MPAANDIVAIYRGNGKENGNYDMCIYRVNMKVSPVEVEVPENSVRFTELH